VLPKNGSPLGPGRSSNVRFATIRPGRAKARNVDEDGTLSFDDGTRGEAFRSAFALSGVGAKAPAMVSANELVSIELALSEQRALVRTAPLESSQPSRRPHDHDVESARRQRVWTIAVKLIQVGTRISEAAEP